MGLHVWMSLIVEESRWYMGATNSAGDLPRPALAGFQFILHYKIQILFCRDRHFKSRSDRSFEKKSRREQASSQTTCFSSGHPSSSEQMGTLPGLPCPLLPTWSVGHPDLCFTSSLWYLEEWLEQVMEKWIKAATLSYIIKNELT